MYFDFFTFIPKKDRCTLVKTKIGMPHIIKNIIRRSNIYLVEGNIQVIGIHEHRQYALEKGLENPKIKTS